MFGWVIHISGTSWWMFIYKGILNFWWLSLGTYILPKCTLSCTIICIWQTCICKLYQLSYINIYPVVHVPRYGAITVISICQVYAVSRWTMNSLEAILGLISFILLHKEWQWIAARRLQCMYLFASCKTMFVVARGNLLTPRGLLVTALLDSSLHFPETNWVRPEGKRLCLMMLIGDPGEVRVS